MQTDPRRKPQDSSAENRDRVLAQFAENHGLHWSHEYQGAIVDSTLVVDDAGNAFQLWLERSNEPDKIRVRAWDYDQRRIDLIVDNKNLSAAIEEVYQAVSAWITQDGNTRTAIPKQRAT